MTITATFSNGFTDTYKGRRAVKAAWMLTNVKTGEVLKSGHSLDRNRAAQTANNYVTELDYRFNVDMPRFDIPQRQYAGASYSWMFKKAREHGFDGKSMSAYKRWAKDQNQARRDEIAARTMIEVVDL